MIVNDNSKKSIEIGVTMDMWSQNERLKLYDAIFHRKSVKHFKKEQLSAEIIADI
jgi:hypothetical protein